MPNKRKPMDAAGAPVSRPLAGPLLAAAAVLGAFQAGALHAAEAEPAPGTEGEPAPRAEKAAELPAVQVTGVRASLATAQEIKQERIEIVDSVVAEDIQKLPDVSVTDALQRITGVQIGRDRGEGGTVAIRGLTQMETLLNGREVFTAGAGRNLNFADIPAELLSGISVYKTSSADHIEGGVGGMVDLRTRRPFDFPGREAVVSARAIHGDLVDRTEPQFSTLLSNRWETGGGGELGILFNLAHQKRAWREDQKSVGTPRARTDLVPGETVVAPSSTSETTSFGNRERTAGTLVMEWRPSDALELYAEGSYSEFRTRQDSHQINVSGGSGFEPGSVTLFPGTNDLRSITWTDASVSVLSFARDSVDRDKQAAVGGSWTSGPLVLKADLSRTESENHFVFAGPFLAATAARFSQDLSSRLPGTRVEGTDLDDPANFRYTGIAYRKVPFEGDLTALRLDGEYLLDGFVQTVGAGVRVARRGADNAPGIIFADTSVSGIGATDLPRFVGRKPYRDFFPGQGSTSVGDDFLAGDLDLARNPEALRRAFGITDPLPEAGNPLGVWKIEEETRSAYLMATFAAAALPLDGNLGLRAVRTRESVSGARSVPDTGETAPIRLDNDYLDYLPSINLRYRLAPGLYLRGAASKTLTRPDFSQLSPSLTLIRNSIDPSLNTGSAGNPELKPIRADNFDLALERYFSRTTSAYLTVFAKKVDGFVTTVSSPEVHDGQIYQVSRPQNSASADIKGLEVGYQQFFDFLPGWLSGLGMQANYTYVDSEMPSDAVGRKLPLQELSRHSYNLVGMYEKGRFSARVAYNWRDKYLSGISNVVGVGSQPVYTRAYGWLDASLMWRLSDKLSVGIEGTNLLGTMRRSFYGTTTRPASNWVNEVQVSATATVRF